MLKTSGSILYGKREATIFVFESKLGMDLQHKVIIDFGCLTWSVFDRSRMSPVLVLDTAPDPPAPAPAPVSWPGSCSGSSPAPPVAFLFRFAAAAVLLEFNLAAARLRTGQAVATNGAIIMAIIRALVY